MMLSMHYLLHFRIFLKNVITLISFFMAVFRISGYPVKLTVATQLIGTICPIDLKTFLANDGLCSCERWNLKPLFCIYSNDSLVLSNVRFSNFNFFRFNFISKNVHKVYMVSYFSHFTFVHKSQNLWCQNWLKFQPQFFPSIANELK